MANAYTTPSDVFRSQVFMTWIKAYLYNNLALLGMAPYVFERQDIEWSDGGDTVTEIKFNGKVVAVDLPTDGSEPDSQKVTMGSNTYSVDGHYVGLEIPRATMEDVTKKGNFQFFGAVAQQVAEAIMDKLDNKLITTALTTDLEHECVNPSVSYDDIIDARAKWGDKMNVPAMLALHTVPYVKALKLEDVRDASKFGAPTLQTGQLLGLAGVPLHVSNNITDNDDEPTTYNNLLIRRNGLWINFRRVVSYRSFPVKGDKDLHEFTVRTVTGLDVQNTLKGAVKVVSQ